MSEAPGTKLNTLDAILHELSATADQVSAAANEVIKGDGQHSLRVHQAEWHVRGLLHHCRNMVEHYKEISHAVAVRVGSMPGDGNPPDALFMYVPSCQALMFEFYALVNLARISLDNLRMLLRPLFKTPFTQLPKSISGYLPGTTDCPVYENLAKQPIVGYLSDLRNCLVHFRSFATSDNTLVTLEGGEGLPELPAPADEFTQAMMKASYRMVGEKAISVNIWLPDVIFIREAGAEKMAKFTYDKRYNLLAQSRNFVRMVSQVIIESFSLLRDPGQPTYTFTPPKKKGKSAV